MMDERKSPLLLVQQQRPILIQGAHEPELAAIRDGLSNCKAVTRATFKFWTGEMKSSEGVFIPVVVSESGIGSALAAASVVVACQYFNPLAIINQGIAGGHTADVCVGDIVVGEYCVNLNAFKTPFRAQNEGSDALDWKPKRNRGVGGGHQDITDESHLQRRKIQADRHLHHSCRLVAEGSELYKPLDKVHFGGVGSSEIWNSEVDRIAQLHGLFGTLCEEMEAAAVAQIAAKFDIPFISIRIISNNITNGGVYDISVVEEGQRFVELVCMRYYADHCVKVGAVH